MPTSEQLKNAGKEAGGVVAGAIGSAVVAWMSGLLSEKYSSSDAEKLTAFRKLYMVELNAKTEPEHLSLDEQGYPKKKYITNIGSINIGIASDNRSGPGQYFASSKLFVGTIGTYLDARYKRTIGSGKKGDVLALVLIEWLDWANNHLPMLDYDNDSLKILEARKRYLSKLISNAYFRHSSYWRRGTTKFDTLIKLQNVLDGCIETCKQEEKKQSVRKYLSTCREIGVGIIKESLTILYLLSDKKAHINYFFAENFMNHGQQTYGNIANDEWNIYQRIRESENGRFLNDTILLGGLNTVGFPQQTQSVYSQYYDEKLLAKKYPWKESDIIKFPWNENGNDYLFLQIETFQHLGERVLDFNSILKILDLAYDVVGGKGDRWASKPAKELLLVALSDLDTTLQKLVDCFTAFIDLQNRSRHKYNHKNSINPQEDWNANFTLISQAIEEIDKYKNSVKISIEAVGNVIRKFPISSDILDTKEKQFSQEVRKRQGIEIPDIAEDLIPEESSSAASSSADMSSSLGKVETWINEINNLRFPITSTLNGFLIIDKPGLKIFKDDEKKFKVLFSKGWGISNYNNWANGFVTYHQKFFNDFHETLDQLKLSISSKDINNIQTQQTHLNAIFTQISNELDKERPMWKFKYGIFPIRLGRPFNRRAASFANLFKTELETTYVSMNSLIGKLILALKSETADNSQKESEELDYLTLMKTIQSLSLSTSESIKNTTQLIAQWNEKKARKTEVQHALSTTLAELEECTPSVEESKVSSSNSSNTSSSLGISTSVAPTDMMVWIEGMYSQYLKWQGQGYQGDIQFFIDTASALKTLDVMVENRNSIDPDVREILLDPIFTLYKELNFCIKKFSTKSSDNQYNLDQLQIFSNLLKFVLDIQPDDNNKSREQFEKLCSGILAKQKAEASIAIPYSSHGLLRPNASVSSNTHRPEYVSPSIVR